MMSIEQLRQRLDEALAAGCPADPHKLARRIGADPARITAELRARRGVDPKAPSHGSKDRERIRDQQRWTQATGARGFRPRGSR